MAAKTIAEKLFPSRTDKDAEIKPAKGEEGAVYPVAENSGVVTIPTGNNAYERTVRMHEAGHLLHSSVRDVRADGPTQAVEDAWLHLEKLKTHGQARRDECAAALMDLRSLWRKAQDVPMWEADNALIGAIRSAAILKRGGWKLKRSRQAFEQAIANFEPERHRELRDDIDKALYQIQLGDKGTAKKILKRWFRSDKNQLLEHQAMVGAAGLGSKERRDSWGFDPWGDWAQFKERSGEMEDMMIEVLGEQYVMEEWGPRPGGPHGRGMPELVIHHPTLTEYRRSEEGRGDRLSMMGMKIRAKKLAYAAIAPSPGRVFVRKLPTKGGGTVVIDSSGSMDLSDASLKRIADAIPMGTVAYYSGESSRLGHLVVYAEKGRQFNGEELPERHGDNVVDYHAMQWLLKQDAPRHLVTDCHWTGPVTELSERLFRAAMARKLFEHSSSLNSVLQKLERGELSKAKGTGSVVFG